MWYKRKELYWKQLSYDKLIQLNDCNTKYFHAVVVGRKKRKEINQLKIGNRLVQNPRRIKKEIVDFYQRLYKKESLPLVCLPASLLLRISEEQAISLEAKLFIEEIRNNVSSCDSYKVAGYDGFNMKFIKGLWDDIEFDFCRIVCDFFYGGTFSAEINMSWVALIPKIDNAVEVKDFKPISMIS